MKSLPTLFKRRSDGKEQSWEKQYEGNKHRTVSGIKDGKMVTSGWVVCVSKNEGKINSTTQEEQAFAEAKAEWELQKKDRYYENIEDIDTVLEVPKPMLAKNYDDHKDKIKWPVWSEDKLDGVRVVILSSGAYSRNGEEFVSFPHIRKQLDPFFKKTPDIIFDGEIYTHKLAQDFNKIIKIVRKQKVTQEDLTLSEKTLEYHVYDLPSHKGVFSERYKEMIRLSKDFGPSIKLVEATECNSQEDLDKAYQRSMTDGFEGQIIRVNGPYENKRSKYLLKRKEFLSGEFKFIAFNEGKGNAAGLASTATLETDDGRAFEATLCGTQEERRNILVGKKPKIVTIKYQCLTSQDKNDPKKGLVPRFANVVDFDRSDI